MVVARKRRVLAVVACQNWGPRSLVHGGAMEVGQWRWWLLRRGGACGGGMSELETRLDPWSSHMAILGRVTWMGYHSWAVANLHGNLELVPQTP